MPTPVDAIAITPRIQRAGVIPRLLPRAGKPDGAPLGSREALVFSLVDDRSSVESLVDATGMSRVELVAILGRLADLKLIALD